MSTILRMLFFGPRPSCTHSGLLDQALSLIHGKQMTYKEQKCSLEVEIKEPSGAALCTSEWERTHMCVMEAIQGEEHAPQGLF